MDDELENFIRERKAKVAEDKASLEQDPPYMEMKAKPLRVYGSTVKENIPPKSISQTKEESSTVGLPLGVEYERKKQRLQHELRMDYRRYMAQKKQLIAPGPLIDLDNRNSVKHHVFDDQAGDLPKQRVTSRRDAATLTEPSRGLHLAEVKTFCPEEDEEQLPVHPSHRVQLGRTGDSEEEEEELELMDARGGHRQNGARGQKRQTSKTDKREMMQTPAGAGRESRTSRALTRNENTEFATGLIIGAADAEEILQRKKERYRQELQEQIAEQHRNKKREKDLELKVAATGANDPEKPPDRIRQFGLRRRKELQGLEPSATGHSEASSRPAAVNEKIIIRDRDIPPPEQPHVAFQSPILEYSSALGGGGDGLSPISQPAPPSLPRATDTTRIPVFAPHPPTTLSEVYRNPYAEPHHYYGTRHLLEPNMAYYGPLSVPGALPPMSYWNSPPGGGVASHLGHHSPHSQYSGSSLPEPPVQQSSQTAVDSQASSLPSERSRSTRDRILSYREALKKQEASRRGTSELYSKIHEQQERRVLEREEMERYEAQVEADMKKHQPWGRGGGGAPLRDSTGNLIADLNQMHKLNEEAYINPEQWQRRATAAMTARRPELPDPNERVSGFTHVQTPQFARGNVFANQPTQQQLQEQDQYKAYLKQQIEEKKRKKVEERERIRLEEEREEKRLAEQRARIQREYEEEQERRKRKEMEQKAKNEELIQLAEQRKKEADRKKKEAEERDNVLQKKQYERERQARVEEVHREPSPPIPTLQKKHQHQYSPRPPTVDSRRSTAPISERSLSGLQSPPVPARRNQLRAAGVQHDVFNELSALRRQLRSEQKRLEDRLQQNDWDELESPLTDRHRERPPVDVFDMARLRLQAPVRRPNSRNVEPRNLLRIHDSLQLKHSDAESVLGFSEVPKLEEVGVASRRRRDYRDPYHQYSSQRSTVQDDYFDLSPPRQNDYLRSVIGGSARGSLLESESAFIDPLGEAFPAPRTPEFEKPPPRSARERRRLTKQSQRPQDRAASSQTFRLRQETESGGGPARLGRPTARSKTAGPVDLSDDESSPVGFSLHNLNHQDSVETVVTDPWMRPGTSDTLKSLDPPLRRERLKT